MTFADIQADVYRRTGYATTPAADVITRIKAFINETYQDILGEPGMQWLWNDQITLASVAAQAEYSLPQTVLRIKSIRDATNRRKLIPMSLDVYRAMYPSPVVDSGLPEYWVAMGQTQLLRQPAVGQMTVVSSAAGDTTQTVYLQGFSSTGVPYNISIALNGTTPVNIPAATSSSVVTRFWISATAAGTVTLADVAAAVLATIPIGQTSPHYNMVALVPTPASVVTYTIDFERTTLDMTIATEEPILPPQFHRLLASGARYKEYEKLNQASRMAVARAEYILGLNQLKYYVYTRAVGTPNLRGGIDTRNRDTAVNVTTS